MLTVGINDLSHFCTGACMVRACLGPMGYFRAAPLAEVVDVKLGGGHPTLAAGGTNRRQHWAMGLDEGTRWRVVEAYHRTSSYARVAKDFGCHVATVRRWVKRYSQTNKVQHAPRSGRPSSGASSEAGKALLEQGLRQGKDCRELARDLDTYLGVRCSAESVRRVVVTLAQQRRPLSKPVLSERHKRDRLAFCHSWVDKNHEVLAFSDSKYFFFNQGGKGYKVWVLNGEEPPTLPAYSKCTKKVHAYAVVTKFGLSDLFFTTGTTGLGANPYTGGPGVNYQVYMDLLEKCLIPAAIRLFPPYLQRSWIWQQDGARPHTAKATIQKLESMGVRRMENWPARSPDLSWIENLWALVSRNVNNRRDVTSQNFERVLREEWAKVQQPRIFMPFASSIRRRLQACIRNNGGETKY